MTQGSPAIRLLTASVLAGAVTFGLFFLMQSLIGMEERRDEVKGGGAIEFVRLKRDSDLETKKRKKPEKQKPEEPPPPPELDMSRAQRPDTDLSNTTPIYSASLDLTGPALGVAPSDSDVIPLVRVQPQYPVRAAERGIEGWVQVTFTISAAGTVKDPVVTAAQPSSIFNRAAIRAIRKWKYNPKVVDGVAVERPGVRVQLDFELED
ncbi:MAG: energy transducer TonB [Proteobacteria bacterium]|nr:energy transducer TonB [Pseudomonadota bacterium]